MSNKPARSHPFWWLTFYAAFAGFATMLSNQMFSTGDYGLALIVSGCAVYAFMEIIKIITKEI